MEASVQMEGAAAAWAAAWGAAAARHWNDINEKWS